MIDPATMGQSLLRSSSFGEWRMSTGPDPGLARNTWVSDFGFAPLPTRFVELAIDCVNSRSFAMASSWCSTSEAELGRSSGCFDSICMTRSPRAGGICGLILRIGSGRSRDNATITASAEVPLNGFRPVHR
jgi:hypothetical protein